MPHTAARAMQLGLLARDLTQVKRDTNATRARSHLVERLGRLHGIPQKIGQILSLGELDEADLIYTPLTEANASLPATEVFEVIESELERPISEMFRSIEVDGVCASLSQVHRAEMHDGRAVAIKVQYPGIQRDVWMDLKALGWMTAPVGGLRRGFDLRAYQREVQDLLAEELDYRHEADTLRIFGDQVSDWPDVSVPDVIPECSGERVLTMTWIEGGPVSDTSAWTSSQRHLAGRTLLRLFLSSCFDWRCLHGDPHPGNLRFCLDRGQPIIGLLDFGCTKNIGLELSNALRVLIDLTISGALEEEADEVYAQYIHIGFNPDLLEPMKSVLPKLTSLLLEPFAHPGPYNVSLWRLSERVSSILGDHRWSFRMAGPAHLLVLLRSYQGLVQYLKSMNVSVNWRHTYQQVCGEAMVTRHRTPMQIASADAVHAARLRIQVLEHGRQKVAVTFRSRAAVFLHELLPDDLVPKLADRGIDVRAIEAAVVKNGFAPGELFALDEGAKRIRVWLD